MRARFARHHSLVVRLTGVSALIAVSSIAATAWLAAWLYIVPAVSGKEPKLINA